MKYHKLSWVVYSDLGDGSGVLLDLKTVYYYSLNRTANLLWKEFEIEGEFTERRLIRKLMDAFDTSTHPAEQILTDVHEFVKQLTTHELISSSPSKVKGHHEKATNRESQSKSSNRGYLFNHSTEAKDLLG